MTRKTQARIERDRQKKATEKQQGPSQPTNCWDELKSLYDGCLMALTNSSRLIPILRNQELMSHFDDIQGAIELGKVIQKDTTEYRQRLEEIFSRHEALVGGSQSPDALMAALMIGEEYTGWYNSYVSVVSPSIQTFLIQADAAAQRLQTARQAAGGQEEAKAEETKETSVNE